MRPICKHCNFRIEQNGFGVWLSNTAPSRFCMSHPSGEHEQAVEQAYPIAQSKKKVTIRVAPDGEIAIMPFGRQTCHFLPGRISAALTMAHYLYRHPEVMPPL